MENTSEDPNAPGALMLPPGEIERWVRDFQDDTVNGTGHTGPSEFCATSI